MSELNVLQPVIDVGSTAFGDEWLVFAEADCGPGKSSPPIRARDPMFVNKPRLDTFITRNAPSLLFRYTFTNSKVIIVGLDLGIFILNML